jgi:hypothetical protein
MQLVPTEYENILRDEGIWLGNTLHSNNTALGRESALKAIEILQKYLHPIKGGDVLKVVDGKMTFVPQDGWYCNDREYATYNEYREKSWQMAIDHIRQYDQSADSSAYYFVFTVGVRRQQ